MLSTFDVSTLSSVHLKYCSKHQRAWVESLDQWVAFPEPAMYGSPSTEAACDTCTASHHTISFMTRLNRYAELIAMDECNEHPGRAVA